MNLGDLFPKSNEIFQENTFLDFEIPVYPPVAARPSSPSAFYFLRKWLHVCQWDHINCQNAEKPRDETKSPARLIHIGSNEKDKIYLTDVNTTNADYVALSYCWGKGSTLTLTSPREQDLRVEIPWLSLPLTFQQAIAISRRLRFRFLWIDALCILQDDRSDWLAQSSRMGDIYANATLVLCADAGENTDSGFLFDRPSANHNHQQVTLTDLGGRACELLLEERLSTEVTPDSIDARHTDFLTWTRSGVQSPVSKRSWCLQEWLCASRVVHFTSHELIWDCKTTSSCECGLLDLSHRIIEGYPGSSKVNPEIMPTIKEGHHQDLAKVNSTFNASISWARVVTVYSSRHLTRPSDRLPAIAGLAKQMCSEHLGRYLAGLWELELPGSLLWRCSNPGRRHPGFIAPSWSWASFDGEVDYRVSSSKEDEASATAILLDAMCIPVGNDCFGEVSYGSITIDAPVISAIITCDSYETAAGDTSDKDLYPIKAPDKPRRTASAKFDDPQPLETFCYPDADWDPAGISIRVHFVEILRTEGFDGRQCSQGILVVPSAEGSAFERVGHASARWPHTSCAPAYDRKKLVLI